MTGFPPDAMRSVRTRTMFRAGVRSIDYARGDASPASHSGASRTRDEHELAARAIGRVAYVVDDETRDAKGLLDLSTTLDTPSSSTIAA